MATKLDWAGSLGKIWADKVEAHDRLLGPIGDAGIAALGNISGKRILDIGCGAGSTSVAMARAGATVVGVDISEDLLTEARARDTGGLCDFLLCDAATTNFDAPFDLIYSRFGMMFFDDPVAGWENLRRQLVSDGKAVFVCWREAVHNEWAVLPLRAVSSVLGEAQTQPSPSGVPGPFAWAEEHVFTDILEHSGWSVDAKRIDGFLAMNEASATNPVEDAVQLAMKVGPLGSRLKSLKPDVRQAVCNALVDTLRGKLQDGVIRLSTAGWLITATP
jgi:SAM-dependent methyltransferase